MEDAITVKENQFVVFLIHDKQCALAIEEVIEITRIQTITNVPGVRKFIPGMINLRGKIIPVIDLHQRYRLPQAPFTKKTRMIVVENDGEDIGLIVDEVKMVIDVDELDVEHALDMFNSLEKDCYKGFAKVDEQFIGVLNIKKVLHPEIEDGGGLK